MKTLTYDTVIAGGGFADVGAAVEPQSAAQKLCLSNAAVTSEAISPNPSCRRYWTASAMCVKGAYLPSEANVKAITEHMINLGCEMQQIAVLSD